jgi:hypothetical protein
MKLHSRRIRWLAAIMALFAAFSTWAEQENHGACKGEVKTLCADVKRGEGRIMQCLKQHEENLSPECHAMLKDGTERMHAMAEDCHGDVENVCKDVSPGDGRVIACLKRNEGKLSPRCKQAVSSLHN